MAGTESFTAGAFTLSGWVTDFVNGSPKFLITDQLSANNFDFNWGRPTPTPFRAPTRRR
jgi:hypothetical protein